MSMLHSWLCAVSFDWAGRGKLPSSTRKKCMRSLANSKYQHAGTCVQQYVVCYMVGWFAVFKLPSVRKANCFNTRDVLFQHSSLDTHLNNIKSASQTMAWYPWYCRFVNSPGSKISHRNHSLIVYAERFCNIYPRPSLVNFVKAVRDGPKPTWFWHVNVFLIFCLHVAAL